MVSMWTNVHLVVGVFVPCSAEDAAVSETRIPTLTEMIEVAKELEMIVFLDVKDSQVGHCYRSTCMA